MNLSKWIDDTKTMTKKVLTAFQQCSKMCKIHICTVLEEYDAVSLAPFAERL